MEKLPQRRLLGRRTVTAPNIVPATNLDGGRRATFDPEEESNESETRSPVIVGSRSTFAPVNTTTSAVQSAPVAVAASADARLQKYLKLLAKSSKVENEGASPVIGDGEKSESLSVFSLSSDQSKIKRTEPKKRISYLKTNNNNAVKDETQKSQVVVSNVSSNKVLNNSNNLRISDALFKAQQFSDKYKKSGSNQQQQVLKKKDQSSSLSLDISEPTLSEKSKGKTTAKIGLASAERVGKIEESPKHLKNSRARVQDSSESVKTVSRTVETISEKVNKNSESVNKNSRSVKTKSKSVKSNSEPDKVSADDVTVSSSHLKPLSMKSKVETEEMEDFSSSTISISKTAGSLKSTSSKMSSVRSLMNIKDVLLDLPSTSPESQAVPKTSSEEEDSESDSEIESGMKSLVEEKSGSEVREVRSESPSAVSYTEDFEESRTRDETDELSESEQTLVSSRSTVVETKVKPKTKDRSVKSVRHSVVEKTRGVHRSCQTLSPEQMNLQNFYHTYSIPFACFMDPQLISSSVVGNRAFRGAVGVSRPGVLVLDDNLKQQLSRLRSGIEAQRRNYVTAINILKPDYKYTTWELTKKIMSRRCVRGRGCGADGPG